MRRQRVALAAEVKAVLDSWARHEQQEKENEQTRLVKTIVGNVLKSVSEEKTQKDVLVWAISEVERECFFLCSLYYLPSSVVDGRCCRARQEQSDLRLWRVRVGR